jgi:polyisoprenoid-binding protein YceI
MRSGRPDLSRLRRLDVLALGLALLAWPLLASTQPPPDFQFQPQHSAAAFSVRLVWFQTLSGQFSDMQGGVRIDPRDHRLHVRARIRVDSVKVHPAHYRKRLLGHRFFAADRHPYIRFVSSALSVDELRNASHLHGRLTLHGVTRPLTLQLVNTRCPGPGLEGCTLHLKGWLDRLQFGMRAYRALVSKRVLLDLVIRLHAVSPAPAPATSTQTPGSR